MSRIASTLFLYSSQKRLPVCTSSMECCRRVRFKNPGLIDRRRINIHKNENLDIDAISFDSRHLCAAATHAQTHAHTHAFTSIYTSKALSHHKLACLQMMGGFVPPSFTPFKEMQHIGETIFTAALLLSILQATIALYQYRTNSRGELVVPPGFTVGVEDAKYCKPHSRHRDCDLNCHRHCQVGAKHEKSTAENASQLSVLSSLNKSKQDTTLLDLSRGETKPTDTTCTGTTSGSFDSRIIFRLNKMALLLLPWIAKKLHYILVRNSHLLHIISIVTLANSIDFWRPSNKTKLLSTCSTRTTSEGTENKSTLASKLETDEGMDLNVVVIGDSLAIGIGCVEEFDTAKNMTLPMCRVEKLTPVDEKGKPKRMIKTEEDIGPVFPKVFARTLSKRCNRRVKWRSAGCDGGMVDDINYFCTGVVQEECQRGHPPDIVIVICGMNDLKKSISNPLQPTTARSYRSSMMTLIKDIHAIAPDTNILFPALPVQTFNKNSAVNILPLSIFLDIILGFWDSQKKLVADISNSNVHYLGLTPREILKWYQQNDSRNDCDDVEANTMLIASDGVHPNILCYSKWAEAAANKFCDQYSSVKEI